MRAAVRSGPQSVRDSVQPNPAAQVNARGVAARRTDPDTADGAIPGSASSGYRSAAPGRLPHPGDALSDVGWVVVRRPWSDDPRSPDTWGFASRGASEYPHDTGVGSTLPSVMVVPSTPHNPPAQPAPACIPPRATVTKRQVSTPPELVVRPDSAVNPVGMVSAHHGTVPTADWTRPIRNPRVIRESFADPRRVAAPARTVRRRARHRTVDRSHRTRWLITASVAVAVAFLAGTTVATLDRSMNQAATPLEGSSVGGSPAVRGPGTGSIFDSPALGITGNRPDTHPVIIQAGAITTMNFSAQASTAQSGAEQRIAGATPIGLTVQLAAHSPVTPSSGTADLPNTIGTLAAVTNQPVAAIDDPTPAPATPPLPGPVPP